MAPKIDSASVVNVRLPADIVRWLDSQVSRGLYHSRSEAIRDFVRTYVEDRR